MTLPTVPTIPTAPKLGTLTAPAPPSPFVTDSFTDANGLLSAHVGEVGATWTIHPNTATGQMSVQDNRACSSSSTLSIYYASGTPAGANYDVSGPLTTITDNNSNTFGVAGRISLGAHTCYVARYSTVSNVYQLFIFVAGTGTQLGSDAAGANPAGAVIKLRMVGDQISLLVNDVLTIGPITNATISAAGQAGLRTNGTGLTTIGVHLDSFSAVDT